MASDTKVHSKKSVRDMPLSRYRTYQGHLYDVVLVRTNMTASFPPICPSSAAFSIGQADHALLIPDVGIVLGLRQAKEDKAAIFTVLTRLETKDNYLKKDGIHAQRWRVLGLG